MRSFRKSRHLMSFLRALSGLMPVFLLPTMLARVVHVFRCLRHQSSPLPPFVIAHTGTCYHPQQVMPVWPSVGATVFPPFLAESNSRAFFMTSRCRCLLPYAGSLDAKRPTRVTVVVIFNPRYERAKSFRKDPIPPEKNTVGLHFALLYTVRASKKREKQFKQIQGDFFETMHQVSGKPLDPALCKEHSP